MRAGELRTRTGVSDCIGRIGLLRAVPDWHRQHQVYRTVPDCTGLRGFREPHFRFRRTVI